MMSARVCVLLHLLATCLAVKLMMQHQLRIDSSIFQDHALSEIESMNFDQTRLEIKDCEFIAAAGQYPNLTSLTISSGYLNSKAIKALLEIRAPRLETLSLSLNQFLDQGFDVIADSHFAPQLKNLDLLATGITHAAMKKMRNSNFSNIERLNLMGNQLGAPGYEHLSNCTLPKLKELFAGLTYMDSQAFMHFSKWNLTTLRTLQMSVTLFLPQDFELLSQMDWSNLQELDLNFIPFLEGPLEHFVKMRLPKLKKLQMEQCFMTDETGIILAKLELPELESIDISANALSASSIKALIQNKPKLKQLVAIGTSIESFEAFEQLPSTIQELHLGSNMIRGDQGIRHFSRFENLKLLTLQGNDLDDAEIAELLAAAQFKFHTLGLDSLPLKEKALIAISNLNTSELKELSLAGSPFGDRVVAMNRTMHFPNLTSLILSGTRIGEAGFRYIVENWKADNITSLQLQDCHINDVTLQLLAQWDLPKLKQLNISFSMDTLTGTGFSAFKVDQFENLEKLALSNPTVYADGNLITLEGAQALSKLRFPRLKHLQLSRCNMSEQAVVHLMKEMVMPSITQIELNMNRFGDDAVRTLCSRNFSMLSTLGIRWSDTTNEGFKLIINKLPWLRTLHATGINITSRALDGCRPEFFQNIEVLELSNNMLNNTFFEMLADLQPGLQYLRTLQLNWNDIQPGIGNVFARMHFPYLKEFVIKTGNSLSQKDIETTQEAMKQSRLDRQKL